MSLAIIPRDGYQLVIRPDEPDWAAVNAAGADVLRRLAAGETEDSIARSYAAAPGLDQATALKIVHNFALETARIWRFKTYSAYRGRSAYLRPRELRELWLHVNNRCNFACRHCLVSGGPGRDNGLPTEVLRQIIAEAHELGVQTFFVTGGEPLLRDDIVELIEQMVSPPEVHVVVLTNGSLLDDSLTRRLVVLDRTRLHLQVSLDGSNPKLNDRLRAPGSFEAAAAGIRRAAKAGVHVTVATVVVAENLHDLPALVRLLPMLGVKRLHLMWQHVRERGAREQRAQVHDLARIVLELKDVAAEAGVRIDNLETYRAIAHGEPSVKRDGTNACWDSLAVYTDGFAYPSAALVGVEEMRGGNVLKQGLLSAWRFGPVFEQYRQRSVIDNGEDGDPLVFFHGGGDPEHAFFFAKLNGGRAQDPYVPLYSELLYSVIDEAVLERAALMRARDDVPVVFQLMGEDGLGCPSGSGVENGGEHRVDFTHSNCVLIEDVVGYSRRVVRDYYSEAAIRPKPEICSPLQGPTADLAHIPSDLLDRTYGCGSPVFAARLRKGEHVIDLGCGVGVECFVASKLVGPSGRVSGVDMTPQMLSVAGDAAAKVSESLGYSNVRFVQAALESLPLGEAIADVVISNCVVNLSPQKLKVFSEVRRILKPGGRLVISDIVAEKDVPGNVRHNPQLRAECVGGALAERSLLLLLSKLGFDNVRIEQRVPWREIEGVQFYSDTIWAERPIGESPAPYAIELEPKAASNGRHVSGCVVCGAPLLYAEAPRVVRCNYCARELSTWATCEQGHFVCDQCHGGDYLQFVRSFVAQCQLTDPVAVFLQMRAGFPFPMHGPEHHALVPAAFLAAYRNAGGEITPAAIQNAIAEAAKLPGGTCAYWGGCSAALGVGVAYGAILKASPLKGRGRQAAQIVVTRILQRLSEFRAARCCRRESLLALQVAAQSSEDLLPTTLALSCVPTCDQASLNRECISGLCPFFPQPT